MTEVLVQLSSPSNVPTPTPSNGGIAGENVEKERATGSSKRPLRFADWDRYAPVDRSFWWKTSIRDVPEPWKYSHKTSLEELAKPVVEPTYGFRSDGRRLPVPVPAQKGEFLMPGAYNHLDLIDWLKKDGRSYSFRDSPRKEGDLMNGFVDKKLELAPGQYNTVNYLGIDGSKAATRHAAFKSRERRLPSKEFLPREGPDPCKYDYTLPLVTQPVRSSFRSQAPRFPQSHTKVPGPGSYDKAYQSPMPANITRLGRQHGLFFPCSFNI